MQLVQGKSRIAPLKKATTPRLELLACCIAARLGAIIKTALEDENIPCCYWTDSTVALAWIQRENLWGAFVGNRVKEINSLTNNNDWKHIPGEYNPADLPSRGCTVSQFKDSKWWQGPQWLRDPPEHWPVSCDTADEIQIQSERKETPTLNLMTSECEAPWYIRASSYSKNVRIMIYILRFVKASKEKSRIVDKITVEEFNQAEEMMFLLVQKEYFLENKDVIEGLRVVRDNIGLIRMAIKLTFSNDERDFRYPILLPHSHILTTQLIRREHFANCHAGVQFLMGKIRERNWIIQVRRAIRVVLYGTALSASDTQVFGLLLLPRRYPGIEYRERRPLLSLG